MKIQLKSKRSKTLSLPKGFTIIEVVLVLAIAGLIFMMVFLALPALQKSTRDTQRKDDLARVMNQLTNYTSNNRGTIPAALTGTAASFVNKYLGGAGLETTTIAGSSYLDPLSGTGYTFVSGTLATIGEIGYSGSGYLCGNDGSFANAVADGAPTVPTARQFAISIGLESQSAPYCMDNR